MEEIKIGEVFQVGRTKLKCVEDYGNKGCEGCFFKEIGGFPCDFLSRQGIECGPIYREDRTQVVFIEVKEGELKITIPWSN